MEHPQDLLKVIQNDRDVYSAKRTLLWAEAPLESRIRDSHPGDAPSCGLINPEIFHIYMYTCHSTSTKALLTWSCRHFCMGGIINYPRDMAFQAKSSSKT